ncbi:MAG: FAD-binding protein, partial [Coriobacteriales bacterium]|nr:FAD-binding protein [Coriobacteriales bacterium]
MSENDHRQSSTYEDARETHGGQSGQETSGFSRRAFLGGIGAAAAVAAAGLAGCSPSKPAETGTPAPAATGGAGTGAAPAFLTPPAPPTNVTETLECDVLVIGVGLAGVAALREAAEAGKKVIAVEKQEAFAVVGMAGDFGVVGSKIQKELGIEWAPKADIINQLQKDMTYRSNPVLFNYWYEHSGEDFDWLVEGAEFEVLPSTAANKSTALPNYIRPKCFPPLEGYDYHTEYYPYFHGTITTNPNMQWACENSLDIATGLGAQVLFGTWGEQLITDASGAVTGAYVKD